MIPEADITSDIQLIQDKFEQFVEEADDRQHYVMMAWQYKAGQMEVLAGGLVVQYNELLGLYNKRSTGFVDCNGKPVCNGDVLEGEDGRVCVEWSETFGCWETVDDDGSSAMLSEENLAKMEIVENPPERETVTYRGYTIAPFHHEYFWCNPQTYSVDFSPDRAGGISPPDSGNGSLKQCKEAIDEFLEDK